MDDTSGFSTGSDSPVSAVSLTKRVAWRQNAAVAGSYHEQADDVASNYLFERILLRAEAILGSEELRLRPGGVLGLVGVFIGSASFAKRRLLRSPWSYALASGSWLSSWSGLV